LIEVPEYAQRDDIVNISAVSIGGQRIESIFDAGRNTMFSEWPLHVQVSPGLQFPLTARIGNSRSGAMMDGFYITPAVSSDGMLYCGCYESSGIDVFNPDGSTEQTIHPSELGLSDNLTAIAFSEPDLLITGVYDNFNSPLVAFNVVSRAVKWRSTVTVKGLAGMAVLSDRDLLVASAQFDYKLFVIRLSTGALVSSFEIGVRSWPSFVVADNVHQHVYAVFDQTLWRLIWSEETLLQNAAIPLSFLKGNAPVIVVMYAPIAGDQSYLVAAGHGESTLHVHSLPECTLLRSFKLSDSVRIAGLATDPSVRVLIVCDSAACAVRTLAWPLAESAELRVVT
jgi:hypothetical protein